MTARNVRQAGGASGRDALRCFAIPAGLHLLVGTFVWAGLGVDMRANLAMPWDAWWQTIPLSALRADLLSEITALHAQPPLHNLVVGLLAGISAEPLAWLQCLYLGMGAATCGLAGAILCMATGSTRLSTWLASAFALHPSLLVYEAFPLYTIPTTLLVMAGLFCAARFQQRQADAWLLAWVAIAALLVLLRSLYHPLFLLLCIGFVGLVAERRLRVVALSALLALPVLAWSGRNIYAYDGMGSTWAGCNLFKIARAGQTDETLRSLAQAGALPPAVLQVPVFSPPGAYRAYGFTPHSEHAALSRNDLHNAVVPDICALYGDAAWQLIAHDPFHYLDNVASAYAQFSQPASGHAHVAASRARIANWERTVSEGLFLGALFGKRGSVFFLLVPLSLGICCAPLRGARRRGIAAALRAEPLLAAAGAIIAWTTLVACTADLGENERFRLPVELPVLMVLTIGAQRAWQQRHTGRPAKGRSRSPDQTGGRA